MIYTFKPLKKTRGSKQQKVMHLDHFSWAAIMEIFEKEGAGVLLKEDLTNMVVSIDWELDSKKTKALANVLTKYVEGMDREYYITTIGEIPRIFLETLKSMRDYEGDPEAQDIYIDIKFKKETLLHIAQFFYKSGGVKIG